MKVYCKDCKYYREWGEQVSDWLGTNPHHVTHRECKKYFDLMKKNRNCDCKHFAQRKPKKWLTWVLIAICISTCVLVGLILF